MSEFKKLSEQGRLALDLDDKFQGKVWAFVPVNGYGKWGLGIAVANERGYCQVPFFFCHIDEGPDAYDRISAHAEDLNSARGLSREEEARITLSSMFTG